ncbi:MAG: ATPase [Thermofilum sp. ex4484_79]|nr:MAG: ATPase [Thermofilum sp. ex4484_79]
MTLEADTPVSERKNMVFMGTYVITGKGEAIVTATGMNTQVGKIATKLGEVREEKTLLERELDRFGKQIGIIILVLALILFVIEIFLRNMSPIDSLLTSIALAVAAVPEGLPAIATVILALGARRMAKRNAIVRKLSAVETLGACDIICSDKTGTITSGEMCVRRINVDGYDIEVTHKLDGSYIVFTAGAPDFILKDCVTSILSKGKELPLDDDTKKKILQDIERYASMGLRTIGFAYRYINEGEIDKDANEIERNLIFLGFVGIMDPPREGVKEAIKIAKKAGIKIMMVTGDHKITAKAIAKEIGLDTDNGIVLEGRVLDQMNDEELLKIIDKVVVFARVTPEHKARIVKLLKKKKYVVAMTGDGVNDALALKMADIGIAMGIRGTDVAKEAADLVLADDNFATIVEAVKEGRIIYDNVKKPIDYLLTCNFGEVFGVSGANLLFLPPILKPAQILWINLMTDALPALGLGVEPAEPDIMERLPRSKEEHLISKGDILSYVTIGSVIAFLVISIFLYYILKGVSVVYARSQAFNLFVIMELVRAFSSRSEKNTVFELGVLKNKALLASILGSLALQFALIYSPIGGYFYAKAPSLEDLSLIIAVSPIPFIFSELKKVLLRSRKK